MATPTTTRVLKVARMAVTITSSSEVPSAVDLPTLFSVIVVFSRVEFRLIAPRNRFPLYSILERCEAFLPSPNVEVVLPLGVLWFFAFPELSRGSTPAPTGCRLEPLLPLPLTRTDLGSWLSSLTRGDLEVWLSSLTSSDLEFSRLVLTSFGLECWLLSLARFDLEFWLSSLTKGDLEFWLSSLTKGDVESWLSSFTRGDLEFWLSSFTKGDVEFWLSSLTRGDLEFWLSSLTRGDLEFWPSSLTMGDLEFWRLVLTSLDLEIWLSSLTRFDLEIWLSSLARFDLEIWLSSLTRFDLEIWLSSLTRFDLEIWRLALTRLGPESCRVPQSLARPGLEPLISAPTRLELESTFRSLTMSQLGIPLPDSLGSISGLLSSLSSLSSIPTSWSTESRFSLPLVGSEELWLAASSGSLPTFSSSGWFSEAVCAELLWVPEAARADLFAVSGFLFVPFPESSELCKKRWPMGFLARTVMMSGSLMVRTDGMWDFAAAEAV